MKLQSESKISGLLKNLESAAVQKTLSVSQLFIVHSRLVESVPTFLDWPTLRIATM
jgi:hypothetical protein